MDIRMVYLWQTMYYNFGGLFIIINKKWNIMEYIPILSSYEVCMVFFYFILLILLILFMIKIKTNNKICIFYVYEAYHCSKCLVYAKYKFFLQNKNVYYREQHHGFLLFCVKNMQIFIVLFFLFNLACS